MSRTYLVFIANNAQGRLDPVKWVVQRTGAALSLDDRVEDSTRFWQALDNYRQAVGQPRVESRDIVGDGMRARPIDREHLESAEGAFLAEARVPWQLNGPVVTGAGRAPARTTAEFASMSDIDVFVSGMALSFAWSLFPIGRDQFTCACFVTRDEELATGFASRARGRLFLGGECQSLVVSEHTVANVLSNAARGTIVEVASSGLDRFVARVIEMSPAEDVLLFVLGAGSVGDRSRTIIHPLEDWAVAARPLSDLDPAVVAGLALERQELLICRSAGRLEAVIERFMARAAVSSVFSNDLCADDGWVVAFARADDGHSEVMATAGNLEAARALRSVLIREVGATGGSPLAML